MLAHTAGHCPWSLRMALAEGSPSLPAPRCQQSRWNKRANAASPTHALSRRSSVKLMGKKSPKQNNEVCEHIKSFSIPSLCFSCYLETGTEADVLFASHSSWDLRGTVYAWVTQLLEAIRQGNFTSS